MTEEELKEFNSTVKKMKLTFGIILGFILLAFITYKCNNDKNQSKMEQTILNDNQKTFRDKDSLSHTTNNVIEGKAKDFIDLEVKDKEIIALQELVKKYKKQLANKGSATQIKTITKYDTIFQRDISDVFTNNRITKDSIKKILSDFNFRDSINNNWINTTFGYSMGNINYSLVVKNEYSVIIGEESQGWFKPKKPFVEVINLNPYSETTKVKTYQVETKPIKKIGIGPGVYYGIGNSFQPQVFVGIGIQYNFIRL